MLSKSENTLYLNFSLPTEEKQLAVVSAAVEQLTVFSRAHGGDWHVRFQDIPDRIWIPHPIEIKGINLPTYEGRPGSRAVYRQVGVGREPLGPLYSSTAVLAFAGFWQMCKPDENPTKLSEQCRNDQSPQLPMADITTVTRCWQPGSLDRFTRKI